MSDYQLFGAPGTGAVAVEAALTLLGEPYRLVETEGEAGENALAAINPMRQVPALVLPSGELMTESAAILIWLADRHGDLAPGVDAPDRPAFLRWMAYVSAEIYALYWVRDVPSRLAQDAAQEAVILARTAERITCCWSLMEAQVSPGPYLLGERLTVLDLYVTVVSRWSPRRPAFYAAAPRMGEAVRRVEADPRLAALWAKRYPFQPGWDQA